MTHIITSLCVREGSCVTVCPVECIIPGKPQDRWPWFYIDPNACIDCGACITECPFHAIYPEDDVPETYIAMGGEVQSAPQGTPGFNEIFNGYDYGGNPIQLTATRILKSDDEIDLTKDIRANYDYFENGPGYEVI